MKLAIIDMDSVMFSIGNGNKILDAAGEPIRENGKYVYEAKTPYQLCESADFFMEKILKESGATHYIAYIKGRNTQFRKSIKEDYKSKRPKESPSWWTLTKEYLKMQWGVVEVNDIEVDDAVNITRLHYPDSFIVAIDQDLLCLEGTHYNWRDGKWITTDAKAAVSKLWEDMITGQSGDGIAGLPGKGEAFVRKFTQGKEIGPLDVFSLYCNQFGVEEGIKEFYQNYQCLKILDKSPIFEPALPIVWAEVDDFNDFNT